MLDQATLQIIIDRVEAKYPGNEWVKKCGAENHDAACYDPSKPHLTYHVYLHKKRCESEEGVSCAGLGGKWIPIGKPVVEAE